MSHNRESVLKCFLQLDMPELLNNRTCISWPKPWYEIPVT